MSSCALLFVLATIHRTIIHATTVLMRACCVAGRRLCQGRTTAHLALRHATTSASSLHTSTPSYTTSSSSASAAASLKPQVTRSALIAQRLCSLNYVQRLLRRLPSATHTDTLLYLNELPANLRDDLVRLALYKLHEEHTGKDEAQGKIAKKCNNGNEYNRSMRVDALRRMLMLRGPRANIAEHKIHNYLRSLPRRRRDDGRAHESDAQPPILLLPRTKAQYAALGLRVNTANSINSVCVQLRSESGADRVDYRDSPLVYVMVVPAHALHSVQDNASAFVQRSVVYDEGTQQLLLVQHLHNTHKDADEAQTRNDLAGGADDVFFAQCYSFDPHAALALAQQLNSTPEHSTNTASNEDKTRTNTRSWQPSYRVFYLIACKEEQAIDARWPSAHSTAHSHAEEHTHAVALCDAAALFPSCFARSVVELHMYTSSDEKMRDAACVPMRLKKLCYERGAEQYNTPGSRGGEDVSLWSTQIAPSAGDDDVSAGSDLSAAENAVPLQKEDMQCLKRVLTRVREQALRAAHGDEGTSRTEDTRNEGHVSPNKKDVALLCDAAVHAAQDERCVRRCRVPFTVVEVTPHTTTAALPCSNTHSTTRCALLAPTLWRLLYTTSSSSSSSSLAQGTSSLSSHTMCGGVVPMALDDLMTARERLLLPFLRRPRQLPRSFFTNTSTGTTSEVRRRCNEEEEGNNKSRPFVPVLWSIAELEQLLGWYTMRHVFADRYGPLRNLLSPELYVSIGDGLVTRNAQEEDEEALQSCEASTHFSSSSSTSSLCFVLVQDLVFVKQVLLPAMHRYSALHHTYFTAHTNNTGSAISSHWHSKAMRAALEVHQTRLAGWLQVLQDGSDAQLQSWLRLTPHTISSSSSSSSAAAQTRMPAPRQSRAFFVGAEGNDIAAVRGRLQRRFAVVPILPFLMWATQPPSPAASHTSKDVKDEEERGCVFSAADLVRYLQYFLTYPAYFELTGGDGTTVAVSLPD